MTYALPWLLAVLAAGPARSAPGADAGAILEQVSRSYRALSSYHFEGVVTMTMSAHGADQTVSMPIVAAAAKPGRTRTELRNPMMGLVIVSDGEQSWVYVPQLGQYTRRAAAPATAAAGDAVAQAADAATPIARYRAMGEGLKSSRMAGSAAVRVDGRRVDCHVVEAVYEQPEGGAIESSPTTFWIDKKRLLVLKDSTALTMTGPDGAPARMKQTTTYTVARANVPLPDSLFAFRPAEGAEEVENLAVPGLQQADRSGRLAEAFSLRDLEGEARTLENWRGKVVLLDFWASWCAPCRKEMPVIEKLHQEFKDKGLVVVGVNVGETAEVASRYVKRYNYAFTILLDPTGEVANLYGAAGIPTVVIIDREGTISSHFVGLRGEEELRAALKKAGVM